MVSAASSPEMELMGGRVSAVLFLFNHICVFVVGSWADCCLVFVTRTCQQR